MSCAFRALPRIIPELILSAPRRSEVVIVSPWIRELTLTPPVVGTQGNWDSRREMQLSEFFFLVTTRLELHLSIVVREYDNDIKYVTRLLRKHKPNSYKILEEEFLHAKVISTNFCVLQMSANLIPTSLYRNVENCNLSSNKYGSSRKYIQSELKLKL